MYTQDQCTTIGAAFFSLRARNTSRRTHQPRTDPTPSSASQPRDEAHVLALPRLHAWPSDLTLTSLGYDLLKRLSPRTAPLHVPHHPRASVNFNTAGTYEASNYTMQYPKRFKVQAVFKGKYEQAEILYRRALTGWEQQLGVNHPDTLAAPNNLALLYYDQGKYEEAGWLYQQALAGQERQLGSDRLDTLSAVGNLANLRVQQSKLEEAETLCNRALVVEKE
ncbi:hypothetical protein FIBSPDRAFT_1037571 [Athelia psychrophila]|uniref:Uncharacterized protein n=1 Tax=Athelia psychrophila TaxID=1759441 RepID=A0A166UEP1_9AGAM|nr:hypothetical protein FIBSPDRAFT_1037571 [Fibularhizoctonia sp. CBS 109695]